MSVDPAIPSLQTYANRLRKKLISGAPTEELLDIHDAHQQMLQRLVPVVEKKRLSLPDRFAWKFIREINILSLDWCQGRPVVPSEDGDGGLESTTSCPQRGTTGIYQDLTGIVEKVKDIWFADMPDLPRISWLSRFSVRKLAHYAFQKDEIGFSLIFDFPETPAEILSYLAYHELLHRHLGAQRVKGRCYSHTNDFKSQEHLFPNWRQMDEKIHRFINHTGRVE